MNSDPFWVRREHQTNEDDGLQNTEGEHGDVLNTEDVQRHRRELINKGSTVVLELGSDRFEINEEPGVSREDRTVTCELSRIEINLPSSVSSSIQRWEYLS